jgi:4-hydroxy-tetrahydrodipicolinate synthase
MLRDKLRGTGVALVTPFTSAGEVDFEALGKLLDFIIRDGVEYIVALGTTGEASTLSREEKIDLINFTYERVNSVVPVVIGIGGNNTKELVQELETFPLEKAFAILSASPYYSKPSQEGIFQHYKSLAATTPKPIILYNVPGRTGRNISAATTLRLATEVDNIAGIKEASGDMMQCMQILKDKPADFLVVSGDDALALPQIACGMDGIISVVANCFPKLFSEMVRHCLKADFKTGKRLNDELMSVYDLLFSENNPAGVKAILAATGMIENELRLPLVPLSDPLFNRIKGLLDQPGLQVKDY